MQDDIDTLASLFAGFEIDNITLYKRVALPSIVTNDAVHLVKIGLVPG